MMTRCAVTGASGYLGSRLAGYLEQHNIEVARMTHSPRKVEGRSIQFSLGDEVVVESLRGLDALVHCAYDFSFVKWEDIVRVNVDGTRRLFSAARAAGVKTVLFVSSMSAFPGCRSLYGRSKLMGEQAAFESGALVIRPGLVYGHEVGGMMGALRSVIQKSSWLPILKTGDQGLHLLHVEDFCRFVLLTVTGEIRLPKIPVTLAHPKKFTLSEIIRETGRSAGKKIKLIPVPGALVYAVLRTAEIFGKRGRLRSDAVLSVMHCDPAPSFAEMDSLNYSPADFSTVSIVK